MMKLLVLSKLCPDLYEVCALPNHLSSSLVLLISISTYTITRTKASTLWSSFLPHQPRHLTAPSHRSAIEGPFVVATMTNIIVTPSFGLCVKNRLTALSPLCEKSVLRRSPPCECHVVYPHTTPGMSWIGCHPMMLMKDVPTSFRPLPPPAAAANTLADACGCLVFVIITGSS